MKFAKVMNNVIIMVLAKLQIKCVLAIPNLNYSIALIMLHSLMMQ